jgi:hypothetical protein
MQNVDLKQVLEVLKYVKGAYNRFEINEEMPKVYFDFLKGEEFEKVMHRLKEHIKKSKFEPTISDLLPKRKEKEVELYFRPSS